MCRLPYKREPSAELEPTQPAKVPRDILGPGALESGPLPKRCLLSFSFSPGLGSGTWWGGGGAHAAESGPGRGCSASRGLCNVPGALQTRWRAGPTAETGVGFFVFCFFNNYVGFSFLRLSDCILQHVARQCVFSFRESRSLRADSSLAGLRSCVPPSLPKQKRFPKEETVKFLEAERQACVSVSQRRPLLAGGCVHFQQAQT